MTGASKWSGRTRLLVIGAIAVLLVGVVVLALVLGGGEDEGADETAAPSAAPSTSEAAPSPEEPEPPADESAEPPADTATGGGLPPALPPVALDEPVAQDGITSRLTSIEAIEGQGVGPGNIGGPALRVTVRIENGTGDAFRLDGVAVNLSYGPGLTPASPIEDPSSAPFVGSLAPGATADGVYVFRVPVDQRAEVTVEVRQAAAAPRVLFTGSVG